MQIEQASFRWRIEKLLRIEPELKPQVYAQISEASEVANLNYCLELFFSAGIATLGLVLNSPAVVIGAMLISPLMGPIMGAGLALATADLYLGLKSLLSLLSSLIGAVLVSSFLAWLLPFHSPTGEILARIQPNLLDLGVALLSGLAGSVVVCRNGGGGGVTALPGVAIAVALMPPLCTVGFGVGSGLSWPIISGAGLLFLTNLAAIIASAFLIFYIVRMDSPEVRVKIDSAILERISHERLYRLLEKTWLSRGFGHIGKLHWRILMVVFVLGVLFVPLRKGLDQVRDETIARGAAQDAVRSLAPPETVVTRQVDLTPERVLIQLIVTSPISDEKIREAERSLLRRTGKEATVTVRTVASETELALLRERLSATANTPPLPPPPPPVKTLEEIQHDLLGRIQPAMDELWPPQAPLQDFDLTIGSEGIVLNARYEAKTPLTAIPIEMIQRGLRSRLETPGLVLIAKRVTARKAKSPETTSRRQ